MSKILVVLAMVAASGYWYYHSKNSSQHPSGPPWEEVSAAQFDSRVLKSSLPALVYFDAVEGCDGADIVFARLRQRWGKQLNVFHFKAESNPDFARNYGVNEEVVFALFQDGKLVKRVEAPVFLKPLLGPDNTVSSMNAFYDDFLAALEKFAKLN